MDDNRDVAALMELVLTALGHQVRVTHNGEEGFAAIRQERPDAILLDIEMPVLDGPGMAYRMLIHDAGYEKIPVVILSGVADVDRVAARVGTPYFLGKPFEIDELEKLVGRALSEGKGLSGERLPETEKSKEHTP